MSDEQEVLDDEQKEPDQIWTIPNDEEEGVYRFVLAAAKRARLLQAGARALIRTKSRKPTKIAMEEVRTGAVEVQIIPEDEPWPPQEPEEDTIEGIESLGRLSRPVFLPGGPSS